MNKTRKVEGPPKKYKDQLRGLHNSAGWLQPTDWLQWHAECVLFCVQYLGAQFYVYISVCTIYYAQL